MEILQMLKDINTGELGVTTVVMFILLGLVVQLIQELIINEKK